MRYGFLLILQISLLILQAQGQDQSKLMGKVNIASPNASSLGKYGDIPVSYHTGVPNISIPVYTMTSGSINMPISLSYHAGGLRVEEQDSWVGAGWSLIAGGAITRTVKDKPDEKQTTSLQQVHGHFSDYGLNSYHAVNGQQPSQFFDSEPDMFSFNFNGYSGKFYFNDDRTPMIVPQQDIKIEYNYTPGIWNGSPGAWSGLGRCIEGFKLTTPDGTKYYFGINPFATVLAPYCEPIEVTSIYTSASGINFGQVISSWYLYMVESADGANKIELNYKRDKYAFYTYSGNLDLYNYTQTFTSVNLYEPVKNFIAGVQLSQIKSSTGITEFDAGIVREDLSRWSSGADLGITDYINENSKTLGSISIKNRNGDCIKKFILNQGYFPVDNTSAPAYFNGIISDKKRLKLNFVQEQNCDGTITNPPYTFEYFTEQVSRKLSFGKDHWGYMNGVTTNAELFPALYRIDNGNPIQISLGYGFTSANRDAAWPAMRAGSLSKITYPTGGHTTFEFEPHKFYVNENNSLIDKTIGGLRIKTITSYDPVVAKSVTTNYSYTGSNSLSSGVLYSLPVYIRIRRNDWNEINNRNPVGKGCWSSTVSPGTVEYRTMDYSDNSLRPMETTQGYHIGYEKVKVTQTGNGASVYGFAIDPAWQINRGGIIVNTVTNPGICDPNSNTPSPPNKVDFLRGEPIYEAHYNEAGYKLSEKTTSTIYTENPVTIPGRAFFEYYIPLPGTSGQSSIVLIETFYEIKTARKTQISSTEHLYQQGGITAASTQTQTFFESNYHNQPTKVITTNSKGQIIEKRIKYAFDYRVPLFENTPACQNMSAGFMNFRNDLLYGSENYASKFAGTGGSPTQGWQNFNVSFHNALSTGRKAYVDCRRTNYTNLYTSTTALNQYQTNHNTAKNNADGELKPILWMQDIYMNATIEVTEWKNNQLVSASYTKYNNLRDDEFGVYPEKTLKIELAAPSSTFTASTVSASGTSVTKDSRYKDLTTYDFNAGNVINVLSNDGVPTSYEWGYNNSLPIAKLANASNKYKDNLVPGIVSKSQTGVLGYSNPSSFGQQVTFLQTQTGTITFSLPALYNSSAQVTGYYSLTGPGSVNLNGTICNTGSGTTSCSNIPSIVSFNNMPAGQYTLTFSCNTSFNSFLFNYAFNYSYYGYVLQTSGLKEFFTANFEESTSAVFGYAHTGNKYFNGSYNTTWTPPNLNARSYIIQWWSLSAGKWVFNTQPYTGPITLTGPLDDVRIFPKDALITTYTYDASGKMTSETDVRGQSLYYFYDKLERLSLIRNNDNNLVKKICYNYAGQTEDCFTSSSEQWQSTGAIRCKPCPANGSYITSMQQHEEVDVNPNSTTYGTTRWVDDNIAGACAAPADWQNTTTAIRCYKNASNENTGYQEQEQKDMNPCSPTYNSLRWTIIGYNTTACPLPAGCVTGVNCNGNHKKCVNGVCETGIYVLEGYYNLGGVCHMFYHYEFSDGSWSSQFNAPADPSYCSGGPEQ
jgi:YD repeat-containing protein